MTKTLEVKPFQFAGLSASQWLTVVYVLLVSLVSWVLIDLYEAILLRTIYGFFPLLMLLARFSRSTNVTLFCSVSALILVVVMGVIIPADIELIEEVFILIPLCFILLFPSSLWTIATPFLLILSYLPSLGKHSMGEFFEDSIELIVISVFASVMSYYQQKTLKQIAGYQQQSLTDDLTGLANRKAYQQALTAHYQQWYQDVEFSFALIVMDLDDFKKINDQYGHSGGDELLIQFAQRIAAYEDNLVTTYRMGGDEFAILLGQYWSADDEHRAQAELHDIVKSLIKHVFDDAKQPYKIAGHKVIMHPTIGVSFFPFDSEELSDLVRNADLAMYASKRNGKQGFSYYQANMLNNTIKAYELERHLANAIELDQFYLLYQPKVCIHSGKILGVEALLRWQHPILGAVSPSDFIPVAEATGLIVPIGRWVLAQACRQLYQWQQSFSPLYVSVNISAVQVERDELTLYIDDLIQDIGLDPCWLELELTETSVMSAPQDYVLMFSALKQLGIHIAIDDFGVAYSSLSYLSQLPIDVLKIDKCFVDACVQSHANHMIVRTIVQLSQNLGLITVAEGVETEQQKRLLQAEGVDRFQGYLFSQPVSPADIEALLKLQQ